MVLWSADILDYVAVIPKLLLQLVGNVNSSSRQCFCFRALSLFHMYTEQCTRCLRGSYKLLHFPSFSIKMSPIVRGGSTFMEIQE